MGKGGMVGLPRRGGYSVSSLRTKKASLFPERLFRKKTKFDYARPA